MHLAGRHAGGCHPCLQEVCQQACAQWQLIKIAVAHRTGTVAVGEPSVIIAASSAHRRDALEVGRGGVHACVHTCLHVPVPSFGLGTAAQRE